MDKPLFHFSSATAVFRNIDPHRGVDGRARVGTRPNTSHLTRGRWSHVGVGGPCANPEVKTSANRGKVAGLAPMRLALLRFRSAGNLDKYADESVFLEEMGWSLISFRSKQAFTYTVEYAIMSTTTNYVGIHASHVPSQNLTESRHRRLRVQQISKKSIPLASLY